MAGFSSHSFLLNIFQVLLVCTKIKAYGRVVDDKNVIYCNCIDIVYVKALSIQHYSTKSNLITQTHFEKANTNALTEGVLRHLCRLEQANLPNVSCIHANDASKHIPAKHIFEGLVDLCKRDFMCDEFLHFKLLSTVK